MTIAVFGSINMDLVARTARLPRPGETVPGSSFQTFPGGKGANQAVACARLGAATRMVGRVGGDSFGRELLDSLAAAGVDTTAVYADPEISSGVALISVEDSAENSIIVVPGANGRVAETDLERLHAALDGAGVLLLQLEIPMAMVVAAAKAARSAGVQVILDPAPARELPPELYPLVDYITPNESEAAALVGFPVRSAEEADRAASALQDRGAARPIIKMGKTGVSVRYEDRSVMYPAFRVEAVDTVAAGDAFNGAFAAALDEGLDFEQAIRWGLAGGALAVTRHGAQPSMPTRQELLAFLQAQEAD